MNCIWCTCLNLCRWILLCWWVHLQCVWCLRNHWWKVCTAIHSLHTSHTSGTIDYVTWWAWLFSPWANSEVVLQVWTNPKRAVLWVLLVVWYMQKNENQSNHFSLSSTESWNALSPIHHAYCTGHSNEMLGHFLHCHQLLHDAHNSTVVTNSHC